MVENSVRRAEKKIELSNFKLNTLLEITTAINNNESEEKIFSIFEKALIQKLHIGKIAMFTNNKQWKISFQKGISVDLEKRISIEKLMEYDQISVTNSEKDGSLAEFDVIIPIYHKGNALAFLLLADFEGDKIEVSPIIKHLKFIQTFANIVIVALENKHLYKEQIRQIETDKELELARNMQNFLFPGKLPNHESLKIQAFYLPHHQVGGDYYDVVEINENETAFCIADISGKGISAALLMSNFQANLRAILNTTSNLKKLIQLLNIKVIESANYEKYITLFIGIYNKRLRSLSYLNAGHQPAILKNGDSIQLLTSGCTVLGMFDQLPEINPANIQIKAKSNMICFTDGLTEIENNMGVDFGIEGVKEAFFKNSPMNGLGHLKKKIEDLKGEGELFDDITLLSVEFP